MTKDVFKKANYIIQSIEDINREANELRNLNGRVLANPNYGMGFYIDEFLERVNFTQVDMLEMIKIRESIITAKKQKLEAELEQL